jgi:hypothetical protein
MGGEAGDVHMVVAGMLVRQARVDTGEWLGMFLLVFGDAGLLCVTIGIWER